MEDKLYKIVDSFLADGELPSKYNENGDCLIDAIENAFKDFNGQYSVEDVGSFESCGYDCGIISVAFVENGKLHHMNFEWEMC